MTLPHPDKKAGYTWEDYQKFPDELRCEIIGGILYDMTPAPTTRHQHVLSRLIVKLGHHFSGKPCEVYPSPIDVKLSDEDIVQPDLVVICDKNKITHSHIEGAPDLVIEILSPSTASKDRAKKMALFAESGVREVWLATSFPSTIEVYVLKGAAYTLHKTFAKTETLVSAMFPDLTIDLDEIFDFLIEPGESLMLLKEDRANYRVRGES